MSDTQAIQARLEPILEVLEQYLLGERTEPIPADLRSALAAARDDARFLQLDDVLEALDCLEALLETDRPDVQDLLPLVFRLQETIQTVSLKVPHVTPDTEDREDSFLQWDSQTDVEDVTSLDEQSRFLLDGALSNGFEPYLVRITFPDTDLYVDDIVALLEQNLSVVRVETNEELKWVSALVVDAMNPPLHGILNTLIDEYPDKIGFESRRIEPPRLTGRYKETDSEKPALPKVVIELEPVALDRIRFFISRLESTVGSEDKPVVRELSRTLETTVSVSLRGLVESMKPGLEELASEMQSPAMISFGGSVERVPAEMADVLREVLQELLRNAIVHGIESPEERRSAGKPVQGTIRVYGSIENHVLTIRVADDGRGIAEDQDDSTVVEADGDGGLARVQAILHERFHGSVVVKSGVRGCTATIALPSKVGVWTALYCRRKTRPFVVPAVFVSSVTSISDHDVVIESSGGRFLRYRDRLVPLVEPHGAASRETGPDDRVPRVVVVTMHGGEFALAVDEAPREVSVVPDGPGTVSIPEKTLDNVPVTIQAPV